MLANVLTFTLPSPSSNIPLPRICQFDPPLFTFGFFRETYTALVNSPYK